MRNDGGIEVIKKAIEKLGLRHKEHISAYGEGNERRLTGKHETADINSFSWVKISFRSFHLISFVKRHLFIISFTLCLLLITCLWHLWLISGCGKSRSLS